MKFEVKKAENLIKKLQQLNEVITKAIFTSCKEKVTLSGMNPEQTILLILDIYKSSLNGFKQDKAKGYIINLNHLLSVLKKLNLIDLRKEDNKNVPRTNYDEISIKIPLSV